MIQTVEQLEELLSEPTPGAIETLGRMKGDLILLGVNGKMGPTLARMAKRASEAAGIGRRIIGVARFSSGKGESYLQSGGIETIACDLLDPAQLGKLPNVENVIFMAGMKFGSTGKEPLTWAMNGYLPGMVCRHFSGSKIVAFSTGNVYGLTAVARGGSVESDPLTPVGDYAMSCVGRERIFEHFSRSLAIPLALIRLNYAVEMRYGVLVDLAKKVFARDPIDLTMGYINVIWQADANAMTLQAFDHLSSPPFVVNVTGPELLSVRSVAERFGCLFGKPVTFQGTPAPDALLSNGKLGRQLFGYPRVDVNQLIEWIAEWIKTGKPTHGKPTHFENRKGKF
jgi:nucleoside-diphosphate-sugar epimerase